MGKTVIIENTTILAYRIGKLLEQYKMTDVEFLSINANVRMTPSKFTGNTDLFIIDLDNNKEGMLEIIQMIRKTPLHQNTPLAVLSGDSDFQTLKRAVALGCSDFILKPFSDETLILKVYHFLGKENQIKELTFPLKPLSEKDGNPKDPGLSWNQGFEIGVEEIDNEHREILERFVVLLSSMREGKGHSYYNDLLLFLKDYVNTHFAHEETLQLSLSYDGYAEHKKHHDDFKQKVEALAEIKASDEVSNSDLIKLNLFVKDWLLHHILFEDQKLGEFVHRLK